MKQKQIPTMRVMKPHFWIGIGIAVLFLLCQMSIVSSTPTGAGGCEGGIAAVGGAHLSSDREVQSGALSVGDITVAIDGEILDPNTTSTFPIDTDLVITVEGRTIDYRGILIRVEAPTGINTDNVILPSDALTQIASVCLSPIVGITHVDNSDKPIVSGIINFPTEADGVFLDITIVFVNDVTVGSAFVYSRFTTNFRAAGASDVPSSSSGSTPTTPPDGTTDVPTALVSSNTTSSISPSASIFPSITFAPSLISVPPSPSPTTKKDKKMSMMKGMMRMMMGKGMMGMDKGMSSGMGMGMGMGMGKDSKGSDMGMMKKKGKEEAFFDANFYHFHK